MFLFFYWKTIQIKNLFICLFVWQCRKSWTLFYLFLSSSSLPLIQIWNCFNNICYNLMAYIVSLSFGDDLIDLNMVLLHEHEFILWESKNCYWIFLLACLKQISSDFLRSCPLIAQSQSFTRTFTTIPLSSSTTFLKFP